MNKTNPLDTLNLYVIHFATEKVHSMNAIKEHIMQHSKSIKFFSEAFDKKTVLVLDGKDPVQLKRSKVIDELYEDQSDETKSKMLFKMVKGMIIGSFDESKKILDEAGLYQDYTDECG